MPPLEGSARGRDPDTVADVRCQLMVACQSRRETIVGGLVIRPHEVVEELATVWANAQQYTIYALNRVYPRCIGCGPHI